MIACPRCKRRPQDGHDSWCSGVPEVIETPGPAPVTVRYTTPSYTPPPPKVQRIDRAAVVAAKRQAAAAEKLAAKLAEQAAKAAKSKAKPAPKPVEAAPPQTKTQTACRQCNAPIIGRHPTALYCSSTCSNAAAFQRLMARTGRQPSEIACGHCGKTFTATKRTNKYCGRQCYKRAWVAAEVAKRRERLGQELAKCCKQCGGKLKAKLVTRQFCTDACQQQHWRNVNGKGPKPKCCQTCGGEFMPDSNVQKHCQPCRVRLENEYQRAWRAKRKREAAAARKIAADNAEGQKVCCDCGQAKPLIQFGLTGRKDGGRMDWCRECHGLRIRVWRDGYRPA